MNADRETGSGFVIKTVAPGVWHLRDAMGVCVTLAAGTRKALLLDTGYGLYGLPDAVRSLSGLPVTVLDTHCHHDHTCGNAQFDAAFIHADDLALCRYYNRPTQRERVWEQAAAKGALPDGLDKAAFVRAGAGVLEPLDRDAFVGFDLGGLTARVVHTPGHTPGSVSVLLEEAGVLCVGDTWNPETWVFFPECEPLPRYIESVRSLLALPFDTVLCSHAHEPAPRERFERFAEGLTAETLAKATPCGPPFEAQVYGCRPEPGTLLRFDIRKR